MRRTAIGLALLAALAPSAWSADELPSGLNPYVQPLTSLDRRTMPAVDVPALQAEDVRREAQGLAPRFALPHAVSLSPRNAGSWELLGDGLLLWRLRITSPGAHSLNLGFSRYAMPAGGRLMVYPASYEGKPDPALVRRFDERDNEDHGQLWTPVVPGDDIVVEVRVPARQREALQLEIGSVNHDYRGFAGMVRAVADDQSAAARADNLARPETTGPSCATAAKPGAEGPNVAVTPAAGTSGSCNVDVVCPEGAAWGDQIRGVAVISTGGSLFCSGSLINNTANDRKPYFLTAAHCSITSGNAASLVTYWNYHNSTCRTPGSAASGSAGNGSLAQFNTGSIFRSASATSDFTLVELDDPLNSAHNLYLPGWDRSSGEHASAVGIHHPSTAEKRISFANNPTTTTSYNNPAVPGDGTHVRARWTLGITEGGSSGSPLFSPERRIIGQLHGGPSSCTASDKSDYYGRLSVSWSGGGSAATRLSSWLDAAGTGAMAIDGLNASGGGNQAPIANAGPDQSVLVSTLVALNGAGSSDPDAGPSPLSYAWTKTSGPAATLSSTTAASPTFTPATTGSYVFQLQVSDGAASASDSVTITVSDAPPPGTASYDSVLKAPRCSTVNSVCDSGSSLLNGRGTKGPEPNQPNTINNSCADGASGTYHSDESNDRIKLVSVDGTPFAAGKQVRIEATVWAYSSPASDKLDLYYAASASSPSWTFVTTLTPSAGGAQTLTATYTLPSGSLQAVRARFRYNGSAAACGTGSYDDHDDLIFAVGAGSTDTTPPTTSITSPTAGATVSGTTTISANASDNVAVSRVDFLVDGAVVGNDTTSPYSYAWATGSVSNGSHSLTTRAYDAAGNVGTSAAVSVTVSNVGPVTVFSDNAESAATTFVKANSTTTTQWTRVTATPYAGSYAWKAGSSTGGNYGNSGNATLTTPTLNLASATTATLSYAFKYSTEANYDFFKVRISTDGGSTWTNLVNVSGTSSGYSGWAPLGNINLNSYVGQTNVKVQFQFTTDGSVTGVGPSIDSVSITKQ